MDCVRIHLVYIYLIDSHLAQHICGGGSSKVDINKDSDGELPGMPVFSLGQRASETKDTGV